MVWGFGFGGLLGYGIQGSSFRSAACFCAVWRDLHFPDAPRSQLCKSHTVNMLANAQIPGVDLKHGFRG